MIYTRNTVKLALIIRHRKHEWDMAVHSRTSGQTYGQTNTET